MIRAKLEPEKYLHMEEGELHKWLEERGFNATRPIRRRDKEDGTTVFEQEEDNANIHL